MSDWYDYHREIDDYEPEYYDEPVRRVTHLGGGYHLIEEDGLCIIDPDPMEERMEMEMAERDAADEAEYLAYLEEQDRWRDLEGNEVLPAGGRES